MDGARAADLGELGNGGIVDGGELGIAFRLRRGVVEDYQIPIAEMCAAGWIWIEAESNLAPLNPKGSASRSCSSLWCDSGDND